MWRWVECWLFMCCTPLKDQWINTLSCAFRTWYSITSRNSEWTALFANWLKSCLRKRRREYREQTLPYIVLFCTPMCQLGPIPGVEKASKINGDRVAHNSIYWCKNCIKRPDYNKHLLCESEKILQLIQVYLVSSKETCTNQPSLCGNFLWNRNLTLSMKQQQLEISFPLHSSTWFNPHSIVSWFHYMTQALSNLEML